MNDHDRSPTGNDLWELGSAMNRAFAEQSAPRILDQQLRDDRAQTGFEANAGKSFRDQLEETIGAYDLPLDRLIAHYPAEWAALIGAFYLEHPGELVEALETDDLLQIAAQIGAVGPKAAAAIGDIVRKATVAYISTRVAAAYRAKRDGMNLRPMTRQEIEDGINASLERGFE
jgi:hypothetical protein